MRALLFLLLMTLAVAAKAQSVPVTTGEHETFSRLVFTFPAQPDWTLVRTPEGYGLKINNSTPKYDISDVYRRITRNRLKSLKWDGERGLLLLAVECPCHAMPFELSSGVLVIDIKDGQPPEGSSFELTAEGKHLPPIAAPNKPDAPVTAGANSDLPDAIAAATRLGNAIPDIEIAETPALADVKNDLLWQLSKGATKGIVDVAIPTTPAPKTSATGPNLGNIKIGGAPEFDPKTAGEKMTGTGKACWKDADLDVASWGSSGAVISEFAPNTTGLVGEFDRPEPENLSRAVHFYISLGFGAEARLLLNSLEVAAEDRALWETMAHIVDLEPAPGNALAGMEGCETYAALWSVLAYDSPPPLRSIAIPAVLRAFSALPLHLRRHLGPGLVDRFLSQNDAATARAIRDAILRAPGEHGAAVDLLEAEIERASGQTEKAEALLEPIVGTNGPAGLASTIASIQLYTGSGREVPYDLATTAEALLLEATGGMEDHPLAEALALAYASQNRYAAAFDLLASKALDPAAVWRMLSETGSDSELLTFAVLADAAMVPTLAAETEQTIARRLITLGFPDSALHWLTGTHRDGGVLADEDRHLTAKAEMQRNDARAVIRVLDGLQTADAKQLRAQAMAKLGDKDASATLMDMGLSSEAAKVARQQGAWSEIAVIDEDDVWKEAASLAAGGGTPPGTSDQQSSDAGATKGSLAATRDLLDETAKARDLLERLISNQAPDV